MNSITASPKLLDQLRGAIRLRHFALSTEKAYVHWCRAFIKFHGLRHPREMGAAEVEAFLTWLAQERQVSASTHRQALSALLFLYGEVLKVNLPWLREIGRPQVAQRLPCVLTADEVRRTLLQLEGVHRLLAQLLYGTCHFDRGNGKSGHHQLRFTQAPRTLHGLQRRTAKDFERLSPNGLGLEGPPRTDASSTSPRHAHLPQHHLLIRMQ